MNALPSGIPPYRAKIQSDWIDFNGHLRDAYYGLVLSYALDDLMDHLGLDFGYRETTHCTLYTLELHMRFLHEVMESDDLAVSTTILDADRKRIHAGCLFTCSRMNDSVATGEVMLLHVHQGDKPSSAPFPPAVEQRLQSLKTAAGAGAAWGPGSRKIELHRRADP